MQLQLVRRLVARQRRPEWHLLKWSLAEGGPSAGEVNYGRREAGGARRKSISWARRIYGRRSAGGGGESRSHLLSLAGLFGAKSATKLGSPRTGRRTAPAATCWRAKRATRGLLTRRATNWPIACLSMDSSERLQQVAGRLFAAG